MPDAREQQGRNPEDHGGDQKEDDLTGERAPDHGRAERDSRDQGERSGDGVAALAKRAEDGPVGRDPQARGDGSERADQDGDQAPRDEQDDDEADDAHDDGGDDCDCDRRDVIEDAVGVEPPTAVVIRLRRRLVCRHLFEFSGVVHVRVFPGGARPRVDVLATVHAVAARGADGAVAVRAARVAGGHSSATCEYGHKSFSTEIPGEAFVSTSVITSDYVITLITMPIDVDEFETTPETELRASGDGPTNAEQVLTFLSANADQAFTPKEIRVETDVPRGSVGVVLSRLEDRGLVRHRGEYWAIAEDADIDVALSTARTAKAAADRLGAEDPEEWGPGMDADSGAE